MYNPETKSVFLSHDIRWAKWIKVQPTMDMTIFEGEIPPPGINNEDENEVIKPDLDNENITQQKTVKQPKLQQQTEGMVRPPFDVPIGTIIAEEPPADPSPLKPLT